MRLRAMAAAGVLVSGAVHFKLYFDWAHENDKVGPAFLLNAGAGLVIAVLLMVWRHWAPPLLAVGFGLSTLAAFVTAATVGLFGVSEAWTGWAVWTAAVAELVAVAAGASVWWREFRPEPQRRISVRSAVHH
jgi:O-antigen/teichoic acid export membrane protein